MLGSQPAHKVLCEGNSSKSKCFENSQIAKKNFLQNQLIVESQTCQHLKLRTDSALTDAEMLSKDEKDKIENQFSRKYFSL